MLNNSYTSIGLMSGTSLDGLDMAYCRFWQEGSKWEYQILKATCLEYPNELFLKLKNAKGMSGEELAKLDIDYGKWLADVVNSFIFKENIKPDFIASHGHTVFHQPENSITLQVGSGNEIFVKCAIPVVCNFRQLDVALGGQGAPLVPIGDKLLFGDFDFCLNLGGIANISTNLLGKRIAYDIVPVNILLNHQAARANMTYDNGGSLASQGSIIEKLLVQLEALDFYKTSFPKSLGSEWIEENILSIKGFDHHPPENILRTYIEHIASRISSEIIALSDNDPNLIQKILVTGGGAWNTYLINTLKKKLGDKYDVLVPNKDLVNFKEALIFAFLGLLRIKSLNNCLASVTGASRDNCGGVIISSQNIIL
ncbi:anhydro-N-acetylmuramic acid kinase [Reichenbachiella sp. MALMAid0571]|uniref:anhydro-N-acetylmuramic acid kinase n=1 Tax=Reichenbachiella sp. MALMAid0571 TaxID=3143939 RepID=UPI0032E01744